MKSGSSPASGFVLTQISGISRALPPSQETYGVDEAVYVRGFEELTMKEGVWCW